LVSVYSEITFPHADLLSVDAKLISADVELYSVDILCENSTSTMPVSREEGWVFSCLSSYIQ